MRKGKPNWIALGLSALVLPFAAGCGRPTETVLRVFHAGSLTVPFRRLEQAFEAQNLGVDVRLQAYGSATAIRQLTELGRPADVIASADYSLIDRLMIRSPAKWADWNVLFARNALCIAHRSGAGGITQANWREALADPRGKVGMSDPNQDPCGYRSLFCVYLTEVRFGPKGLFESLVAANSNVVLEEADTGAVIRVPANVARRGRLVIRPKETDLTALLEVGAVDCLLTYRSVAEQHGLDFLALPDEVSLANPALNETYGRVRVVQFADRADQSVEIAGSAIVYGLTVPSSAPHPRMAERFVRLLLSDQGRQIMEESGQSPLTPPLLSRASRVAAAPFQLHKLSQ